MKAKIKHHENMLNVSMGAEKTDARTVEAGEYVSMVVKNTDARTVEAREYVNMGAENQHANSVVVF